MYLARIGLNIFIIIIWDGLIVYEHQRQKLGIVVEEANTL